MTLLTQLYIQQKKHWPSEGHHILAQYDAESIVIYQAYHPAIGRFAAEHGHFGGGFDFGRMSWVKPNFLWMMYRSGWGTKENQEVTLAIRLKRTAFDEILRLAVHSSFVPAAYSDHESWKRAVARSNVRLQWDPDHDPAGNRQSRRAIQLGLRGDVLRRYSDEWILEIQDISEFVSQQRANAVAPYLDLVIPLEEVYPVTDADVVSKFQ
ncbi:DUF4291 domain-containing protein [Singulisphaera sp. PoT]|uniref:DUF4291 domain-containing protein n=1 Tax=Singulisphaera sp. PoT TaxID=3411797 RepID=UPI003BF57400